MKLCRTVSAGLLLIAVFASADTACRAQTADDSGIAGLVRLLGEVDDSQFQLDLLRGMLDGLRGRKQVEMPSRWPPIYAKLSASSHAEVRRQVLLLALQFDDPQALETLRATVATAGTPGFERVAALEALVQKRAPGLAPLLIRLLDDGSLRSAALKGLAVCNDPAAPPAVLGRYAQFSKSEKQGAIHTLASRRPYANALLDAMADETVPLEDVSAFTARQLRNLGDEQIVRRLKEVWGEVRQTSEDKQALIAKYRKLLTPAALRRAKPRQGRRVYDKTCAQCHKLFGEGVEIGPDLTGSNRADMQYVLENVADPSAVVAKGYQLTNVLTADGQLISGIVVEETDASLTLQATEERVVIAKEDIDERETPAISMMPEGQFDTLSNPEICDLIAYLASQSQVPLPPEPEAKVEPEPQVSVKQ